MIWLATAVRIAVVGVVPEKAQWRILAHGNSVASPEVPLMTLLITDGTFGSAGTL